MDFLFKKTIAALLLPVPIVTLLVVIALFFLWSKKIKVAQYCLLGGGMILVVFSTVFVPNCLLGHLEQQYQPLMQVPENVHYIVVLGGGNGGSRRYPASTRLSSSSLSRLVEAIRVHHLMPKSILLLSGGRVFGSPADADVMNSTAAILGVPPADIRIESGSKNTFYEAKYIKRMIGQQRFILVTSAFHMPRAMAIFKKQGMHPIAAPTQYWVDMSRYNIKRYFPNSLNLLKSDVAIHEYLGLAWAWMCGRIER